MENKKFSELNDDEKKEFVNKSAKVFKYEQDLVEHVLNNDNEKIVLSEEDYKTYDGKFEITNVDIVDKIKKAMEDKLEVLIDTVDKTIVIQK